MTKKWLIILGLPLLTGCVIDSQNGALIRGGLDLMRASQVQYPQQTYPTSFRCRPTMLAPRGVVPAGGYSQFQTMTCQ